MLEEKVGHYLKKKENSDLKSNYQVTVTKSMTQYNTVFILRKYRISKGLCTISLNNSDFFFLKTLFPSKCMV